jgi:mannose-1-phosphate guanylyltransferase
VLVGAHPWTNSPFDRLLPRALLPVAHRPLISYAFSWFNEGGITRVSVCANRETRILQTAVLRYVPAGMGVAYVEDAMPRGAAGAVHDAVQGRDEDSLVVVDGTVVPTVPLGELLDAHNRSGAAVTVVVHAEAVRHGNPPLHVPTGVYVFSRRALSLVPSRGFCDIKEHLIPALHRAGEVVATFETESASPRVLDSATYLALSDWTVERLVARDSQPEGYIKTGSCLFHADSLIAEDTSIVGPVLVGPGVRVMSGAIIVGPASIGREATIGRGAVVSRSTIWRRSIIGEHAVADRCVLADDTLLEPHAHVFRSVLSGRAYAADLVGSAESVPRRNLELVRRMRRAVIDAT